MRRPQLAQLIILGMGPSRVLRWLILELLILATLGTLLGVLLGSLLALALMGQLTQALADLYGPNPIDLLRLSPVSLLRAQLDRAARHAGCQPARLVATAAPIPPRTASRKQPSPRSPVATARAGHRHPAAVRSVPVVAANRFDRCPLYRWRLAAGHGALAARCPARPAWLVATARGRPPPPPGSGWPRPSITSIGTAIAVMALQLAIAAAIGIGVMVSSFRSSVEIWLGQRLAADLYVTAPQGGGGQQGHLERYNPRDPARQSAGERRLAPLGAPRPLAGAAHRMGADGLYPPA